MCAFSQPDCLSCDPDWRLQYPRNFLTLYISPDPVLPATTAQLFKRFSCKQETFHAVEWCLDAFIPPPLPSFPPDRTRFQLNYNLIFTIIFIYQEAAAAHKFESLGRRKIKTCDEKIH